MQNTKTSQSQMSINALSELDILVSGRLEGVHEQGRGGTAFDKAFIEPHELAKMNVVSEARSEEMPDPDMMRGAIELIVGTIFDVCRDTRMEEYAQQLAWGVTNSFHMTARIAEGREDDAAKKLGDLARRYDPSEIYAVEMEETQALAQTLQGVREALEAMRDYASDVYRVETGRPFTATRGSQVSKNGVTASQIQARDFLAARNRQKSEQMNPTGPMVVVSGGQQWHDHDMIWEQLDDIKSRVPEMVLATTGMRKGVDQIALAWAQHNKVEAILFMPDRKNGNRAPFLRNEKLVRMQPVEALVCEGSGIQSNLAQRLRQAGVPLHIFRTDDQAQDQRGA